MTPIKTNAPSKYGLQNGRQLVSAMSTTLKTFNNKYVTKSSTRKRNLRSNLSFSENLPGSENIKILFQLRSEYIKSGNLTLSDEMNPMNISQFGSFQPIHINNTTTPTCDLYSNIYLSQKPSNPQIQTSSAEKIPVISDLEIKMLFYSKIVDMGLKYSDEQY